jgi:hypothetical protein
MTDKRAFPRLKRRLIVDFVCDGAPRAGYTHDVSYTGMFVISAHLPPIGEPLAVVLNLTDGKKIRLDGTVVRSRRIPPPISYSLPSGFSFELAGYSEEYTRYLASLGPPA